MGKVYLHWLAPCASSLAASSLVASLDVETSVAVVVVAGSLVVAAAGSLTVAGGC